jgi:hypothetical protein
MMSYCGGPAAAATAAVDEAMSAVSAAEDAGCAAIAAAPAAAEGVGAAVLATYWWASCCCSAMLHVLRCRVLRFGSPDSSCNSAAKRPGGMGSTQLLKSTVCSCNSEVRGAVLQGSVLQAAFTTKLSIAVFHAVEVLREACRAEGPPASCSRGTSRWCGSANLATCSKAGRQKQGLRDLATYSHLLKCAGVLQCQCLAYRWGAPSSRSAAVGIAQMFMAQLSSP